ncbi:MAG: primosomal protein N' [Alteromonadaceae bacterium]|nr:primosomal protein N' [Alteromonadaceae bacterium]
MDHPAQPSSDPNKKTPQILRVALPRPVRQFFDYTFSGADEVMPGQRVRVFFGRQTLVGVIVAVNPSDPPDIKLRPISALLDRSPLFPDSSLTLIDWAARYYQHPPGECFWAALPPPLRQGKVAEMPTETTWTRNVEAVADTLPKRAKRQHDLLRWFAEQPGEHANGTLTAAGFTPQVIRGLAERGFLARHERTLGQATEKSAVLQSLPAPNAAQQSVLDGLPVSCDAFAVHLIHGITGSGKTEVYMHWLRQSLPADGQALVLVPEINLTPQTVARFVRHFGARVALWHSALTDTERLRTWLQVQSGEPVILVSTRSGVLLPFSRLKAVVVDEEHDGAYKQNDGFRYSARDLSLVAARQANCPVLLGSATPSLESLHNVEARDYRLHSLAQRAGKGTLPSLQLVDIRSRPLVGGVSPPLMQAIENTLALGQQVLLFINRRGYAPVLMCYDCGHLLECRNCDTRLTLHRRENRMRCHHCDFQRPVPKRCDKCGGENLNPVGEGTEKTEDVLTQALPDYPIIRIDRDSTRKKGSLDGMLAAIHEGKPCVLVGTQMLTKGHDFPNVTLVGVLNADGGLFSSDFRGPEQLAQTVTQVAGRAGRGEQPGRVLIQTCHADHPLLQQLCQNDYLTLARSLLQEREDALLPPCSAQIALRFESPSMELSIDRLVATRGQLEQWRDQIPEVLLLGPFPAAIARKANRHRAYLILQADNRRALQRAANALTRWLEQCRFSHNERWLIDVDPQELD